MITANQLLAHAVGDYVLQTDWMANSKTTRSLVIVDNTIHVVINGAALTYIH